jgi:hypothetical protein
MYVYSYMNLIVIVLGILVIVYYLKGYKRNIDLSESEDQKIMALLSNSKVTKSEAKELKTAINRLNVSIKSETSEKMCRYIKFIIYLNFIYVILFITPQFLAPTDILYGFGYDEGSMNYLLPNLLPNFIYYVLFIGVVSSMLLIRKNKYGRFCMIIYSILLLSYGYLFGIMLSLIILYILWNVCGRNNYRELSMLHMDRRSA